MEYLTFEQIEERESVVIDEDVYITAWKGYIKVRPLLLCDMNKIQREATDSKTGVVDLDRQKILFIQNSVIEPKLDFPKAQQLCSDQMRASASNQIWSAVNRVNGLSEDSIEEATKSTPFESESPVGV